MSAWSGTIEDRGDVEIDYSREETDCLVFDFVLLDPDWHIIPTLFAFSVVGCI